MELKGEVYVIDRPFESMHGPSDVSRPFRASEDPNQADQTYWLKGLKVTTEGDTGDVVADELFCHANLAFLGDPQDLNSRFETPRHLEERLFTLVEGRLDIRLPEGFGIPVKGDTVLRIDDMTHNLNFQQGDPALKVRFNTTIDYLTSDHENGQPLKPLFRRSLYVYDKVAARAKDAPKSFTGYRSLASQDEFCQPAELVTPETSGTNPELRLDTIKKNPIHWRVPPGVHEYKMEITDRLDLPFDTTAHYVSGHMHTHAEWLRLIDLETGAVLVDLSGETFKGRRGMEEMESVSSQEGIPLKKDGRYQLAVKYRNTTTAPIDAMAIMYVYLLDEKR